MQATVNTTTLEQDGLPSGPRIWAIFALALGVGMSSLDTAIANTACVVFNSRGIPVVDAAGSTGSPTANQAVYVTDGTAIFAATVTVTGVIRLWRTNPLTVPAWAQQ